MKKTETEWTPYNYPRLVVATDDGDTWVEPSSYVAGEVYVSLEGNGTHLSAKDAKKLAKALLAFAALKRIPKEG